MPTHSCNVEEIETTTNDDRNVFINGDLLIETDIIPDDKSEEVMSTTLTNIVVVNDDEEITTYDDMADLVSSGTFSPEAVDVIKEECKLAAQNYVDDNAMPVVSPSRED